MQMIRIAQMARILPSVRPLRYPFNSMHISALQLTFFAWVTL
jgi:hypothetical protein